MKKLYKMSLIVLIPLISGIVLLVVGGSIKNELLIYIGSLILSIGLPVTMLILVVVGLVLLITGKLNLSDEKENGSTDEVEQVSRSEKEISDIEEVNSSYGYESRQKEAEFIAEHVAENYEHSSKKDKILGWLFFGFLITSFALIFVFVILRSMIGAIVCFSLFAGTLLITCIVKLILARTSIRINPKKVKADKIFSGTVKSCTLSGVTSTGGNRSTTRIKNVTYKVVVIVNGQEYTAYSEQFYETGDCVTVIIMGKHRAAIYRPENS